MGPVKKHGLCADDGKLRDLWRKLSDGGKLTEDRKINGARQTQTPSSIIYVIPENGAVG